MPQLGTQQSKNVHTYLSGKAISQHCDASQYNEAAILEERMANNHSNNKNFDASIEDYHRASKLYTAANMHDNADRTRGATAYLFGMVGRIRDAAYSYQSQAKKQTNQLKKFNVPSIMLRAGVLLLSDCLQKSLELDFSAMREMIEEMHELDCRFAESQEHAFLVDMMQCVIHGDLDKFADSLFSFNSLNELDDLMLDALEIIKSKIT